MPNALIHETSPYLLQHAHNPVAWLPWGEEAFARARAENKLVFLSVGYSTCHWCHVMERESFENADVAEVMNHHFINVKVDREERPDVDAAYMAFVQASTGQGGWPMSVWLTPAGHPVFGGTYFPPDDRHGRVGFVRVCHELARLWRDDRGRMEEGGRRMTDYLRSEGDEGAALRGMPGERVFGDFLDRCEAMFDGGLGGFGGAPKFPRPVVLRTLMQLVERFGPESTEGRMAWDMAGRTLAAMAAGGMHDHLGGGFHRYSVDRYWHVPHYEKMLYDQAQLALAYLDAWQISGEVRFRETADGVFRYLLGDLRDPGGAFHAAEDADSLPFAGSEEKKEGAFWTWEAEEIGSLLAPREAMLFCKAYGVEAAGNARPESDPHGELEGRNTLFRAVGDEDLAVFFECDAAAVRRSLEESARILHETRGKRPPPHRDDKIVTAWNGLTVAALARGARVLDRPDLTVAARQAAGFLKAELWDGTRLYRSWRGRRGEVAGFPIDYACLTAGLIELHGVDPDGGWLGWAAALQERLDADFWDAGRLAYVIEPGVGGEPLWSIRDDYDGAEPSADHLAACNLIKLASLLDEPAFALRAEALLRARCSLLEKQPFAVPVLLEALDLHQRGVMKVQVPELPAEGVMERLQQRHLPRAVFAGGGGRDVIVCEGSVCRVFS